MDVIDVMDRDCQLVMASVRVRLPPGFLDAAEQTAPPLDQTAIVPQEHGAGIGHSCDRQAIEPDMKTLDALPDLLPIAGNRGLAGIGAQSGFGHAGRVGEHDHVGAHFTHASDDIPIGHSRVNVGKRMRHIGVANPPIQNVDLHGIGNRFVADLRFRRTQIRFRRAMSKRHRLGKTEPAPKN